MAARPAASPTSMPRVCRPSRCGLAAVAAVIVPPGLRATARATRWRWRASVRKAPILRDVLRVVLDPADQGRTSRVQPRQTQEIQAWEGGDAALVVDPPVIVDVRHVTTEWSTPKPVAQITASTGDARAVRERHGAPVAAVACARIRNSTPRCCRVRRREPMSVSRCCNR